LLVSSLIEQAREQREKYVQKVKNLDEQKVRVLDEQETRDKQAQTRLQNDGDSEEPRLRGDDDYARERWPNLYAKNVFVA
jgi:hypothetical protein